MSGNANDNEVSHSERNYVDQTARLCKGLYSVEGSQQAELFPLEENYTLL